MTTTERPVSHRLHRTDADGIEDTTVHLFVHDPPKRWRAKHVRRRKDKRPDGWVILTPWQVSRARRLRMIAYDVAVVAIYFGSLIGAIAGTLWFVDVNMDNPGCVPVLLR